MNYEKPVIEDRTIGSLQTVRWRLVESLCEIDKQINYLERCKEIKKERGENG